MKHIKYLTGIFIKILIALLLFSCAVYAQPPTGSENALVSSADKNVRAEFFRYGNNDIIASIKYNNSMTGNVFFALYEDGRLVDVKVQELKSGRNNEHKFEECSDNQNIKILFWDSINKSISLDSSVSADVADIKAPDVIRVNSEGYLSKNDGSVIQLRGVNFGGWLLQETWMCPVLAFNGDITVKNGTENGWANLDTLNEMEKRFGKEETARLIKSYQDNYITEWDFENVKNMGFNCIRIPFWYRNFMSDEEGTYITEDDDINPGFQKLDWSCDMAEKYGLYLIFDMHGCPGGQNGDHSSGKTGRNYLYKETRYQDIMEELWVKIADRYKSRACIAAYDIMNEPFNNADAAHNVQSKYAADVWDNGDINKLRVNVYDRMIKAIRRADPYHVITVEGIWRLHLLPKPSEYSWTNVMYQLHSYDSDDETTAALVTSLDNYRKWYKTAGLMGEFNPSVYNNKAVKQMNEKGISYTMWNYKTAMLLNDSKWGLYHKTYSAAELSAVCGSATDKVTSSWDGVSFSLKSLSDSEILTLYSSWWTEKYLSTKNFKLNNTLRETLSQ